MNKVAHYLQEHLVGEVMTGNDARKYFSTDGSILSVVPSMVVYPRNENDVRKTARFAWQLAERGRVIPITARGSGTDQAGAAIGQGIILAFPAHMNRVLELDSKSGVVTVEPGINYGKLQQTLYTHSRFLPPYPTSMEYSTIGGAIANNASGERSVKYGNTRDFVKRLRVVLANGEVIETRRLSRREFNKKLGLASFEGEIYRGIDAIIEEKQDLVRNNPMKVTKNSSGYALDEVKRKDGSFDLTPLIVGSQGTLGIVTEATMETEIHSPNTTLIVGLFDDPRVAQEVILEIRKLKHLPCAIEMVDSNLLEFVHQYNPNYLKGILDPPFRKLVLLIELDDPVDRVQKKLAKRISKILANHQIVCKIETETHKKEELWKVRLSASALIGHSESNAKALPIIEDGVVPIEHFAEFVEGINQLCERYGIKAAIWGHAGNANLHTQPLLDLAHVGDRQKLFRLMDEYYQLVKKLDGSITGQHGDGRLRAPYVEQAFGSEWYELLQKVKLVFDPYGILNPGVKLGSTIETIKPLIRQEYTLDHLYDHLVRN